MIAIGIVTKTGRYGDTYARSDIALEFALWVSAEFKLYIMKDYQRLKQGPNCEYFATPPEVTIKEPTGTIGEGQDGFLYLMERTSIK